MADYESVTVAVSPGDAEAIRRCAEIIRHGGADAQTVRDLAQNVKLKGIPFQPSPGQILVCNFGTGFRKPEITKVRPVVVVSPQPRFRSGLCTVVPLSTVEPENVMPYHYKLPRGLVPNEPAGKDSWAKCDLVATVGLKRLDRVRVQFRNYVAPIIPPDDLKAIRKCLLHVIGLDQLTAHL